MPRIVGYNSSSTEYAVKATGVKPAKQYGLAAASAFDLSVSDVEFDEVKAQLDTLPGVTYTPQDGVARAKLFTFTNPAAKGVTAVCGSIQANAVFGAVTQPAIPRNLVVPLGAGWDGGDVVVPGTDFFNRPISETFAAGTSVTRVGSKIFKTVGTPTHTLTGTAGGTHTASIGTGDKLGIPAHVEGADGQLLVDFVGEAVTVDPTYPGFTPTTVPNGAHDYQLTVNC